MLKKTEIINAVNEMEGETVDLRLLQEKLFLLHKIKKAEEDIKEGRVFTTEQLKANLETWRQPPGQTLPKTI